MPFHLHNQTAILYCLYFPWSFHYIRVTPIFKGFAASNLNLTLLKCRRTHKVLRGEDPISGRKIINNYEFWEKLGSGAHGTVKRGRNLETGTFVAVKIVRRFSKKLKLGKSGDPDDEVKKEVAVLKKARHPHVVSLFEVIDDKDYDKVYLILEYVERGEITWRKRTDKDVALFEMYHVKREKAGDIDPAFEEVEIERFNDCAPARRAAKARILAEQRRQAEARHAANKALKAGEHGSTEQGSSMALEAYYWSLEYGGELENELEIVPPQPFKAPVGKLELRIPEGVTMGPRASSFVKSEQIQSEEHANQAGLAGHSVSSPDHSGSDLKTESRTNSPMNLEGTMYGPYAYERSDDAGSEADINFQLDRIIAEQDRWTAEEEEYMHVPCLTLSQAREAFRDTVLGLEYLHYQGIIHRDIKPANLLWTADYRVKISDFGVSYLGRPIREDEKGEENYEANAANLDEAIELAKTVGTPFFYAPELCDPELFDTEKNPERPLITGQIDVWALGVTLYGMVYGRLPFVDVNEFVMYERIAREEVFIPRTRLRGVETSDTASMNSNKRSDDVLVYEEVDDALGDLLKRLLHKQPGKRITLKEVKHHPWVLRGIPDPGAWIDETDPSMQSQGKKIEVSTEDIQHAVVGLTLVDRIKSGIKRLSSVVRGRDQRKRAESNVKAVDLASSAAAKGTMDSREGRRASVRGDEQIFTALKASRETSEHPLAHSVAASPATKEGQSYFADGSANSSDTVMGLPPCETISPGTRRPYVPERATSAAESVRTIKAPPHINLRRGTPPPIEDLPNSTTAVESNASNGLSGIFSGAGRRFVRGMQSREPVRDGTSHSSRSSSVEGSPYVEDSHASPSIAFSSAVAAGHVDQPPVLCERSSPIGSASPTSPRHHKRLNESSPEIFQRAQEQNYRRQILETERDAQSRPRDAVSPTYDCPPSPDDEVFYSQQQTQQQQQAHHMPAPEETQPLTATSSSDDQFPSCISESYSHPSIPSVVSGASSLSTVPELYQQTKETPTPLPLSAYTRPETASQAKTPQQGSTADDDEAGYNGDGDGNGANIDEDDDDESEDEGIMFGSKKLRAKA